MSSSHIVYADRASLAAIVGNPTGQDERLDIALVMASRWVDRVVGASPVVSSVDLVVALYQYEVNGAPDPAPAVGTISHSTKAQGVLHVHKEALDSSQNGAALMALVAGDSILADSIAYELTGPPADMGDHIDFAVSPPVVTNGVGDPEQTHFTHYVPVGANAPTPRPIDPPVSLVLVPVDVGVRQASLVAATRFLRSPDVPFGVAGGLGDLAIRIYADIPEAELHLTGLHQSWGIG